MARGSLSMFDRNSNSSFISQLDRIHGHVTIYRKLWHVDCQEIKTRKTKNASSDTTNIFVGRWMRAYLYRFIFRTGSFSIIQYISELFGTTYMTQWRVGCQSIRHEQQRMHSSINTTEDFRRKIYYRISIGNTSKSMFL